MWTHINGGLMDFESFGERCRGRYRRHRMVKKYRKKPIIIEAVRWVGDNIDEILEFGRGKIKYIKGKSTIETLEGTLTASMGDYIIRGKKGEYYPCKPDVFRDIYEEVDGS